MIKRSGRYIFIIAAAFIIMGAAATYAVEKYHACIKGVFFTGSIDVKVAAYMMKEGRVVMMQDDTVIDRYGEVSYIPRIINKGESCYVRVKIRADIGLGRDMDIADKLCGVNHKWQMKGGYLYYTEPLSSEKSIDICRGFKVPEQWEPLKKKKMNVNVTVDAVQAGNFSPDFRLEEPWGSVEILSSHMGDKYTVNRVTACSEAEESIKLMKSDKAGVITLSARELFSGVNFMPGDEYEEIFTLTNTSSYTVEVMLRSECGKSDFSDMLQLTIDNGSGFYKGALSGKKLKKYKRIAVLEAGESKAINVKAGLPQHAGNSYQNRGDKAIWYFTAERLGACKVDKTVKTADETPLARAAFVCLILMTGIFMIWRKGYEKSSERNH